MRRTFHTKQAGYTLVELLVAILLVGVVLSVFISAQLSMANTATRQRAQLSMISESQTALSIIERDVRLALAFETTLPAPFSDTYGPTNTNEGWTGSWTYKGNIPSDPGSPQKALILRQNSSVLHPFALNRTPVYIQGFVTNPYAATEPTYNCTTGVSGALTINYKLPYIQLYFVRNNTLYRRIITDTATALCNGPQYQKTSCPREDTTPATSCKAKDEAIAQNVKAFSVTYYEQLDTPTPTFIDLNAYNSSDPAIFKEVTNVLVSITLEERPAGKPETVTQTIRVSRIN